MDIQPARARSVVTRFLRCGGLPFPVVGLTMAATLLSGHARAGQGSDATQPMLVVEDVMHADHSRPSIATQSERRLRLTTAAGGVRFRTLDFGSEQSGVKQIQTTEAVRGTVNVDQRRRFTLTGGVAAGRGFNGGWNTTGIGTGSPTYDLRVKQLFTTTRPVRGAALDVGGLSLMRGESTEATSYDNDGYTVGERLTLERPFLKALRQLSFTRGYVGDLDRANVFARLRRIGRANYYQALVLTRVRGSSFSLEYTTQSEARTVRGAIAVSLARTRFVDRLRLESYGRLTPDRAYGYAVSVQRHVSSRLMASGGLAQIDRAYGPLNGDVYGVGLRAFGAASLRLRGGLLASAQMAQGISRGSTRTPRTRVDLGLAYDLLRALAVSTR